MPVTPTPLFRFVDLFSGVGGFHKALAGLGGECVLACDIDKRCNDVYETNYGIRPLMDIRRINTDDVPDHDVLCAGFPCQPFSKGGSRAGFADKTRGTLFYEILRIAKAKKPRYLLLENVANFVGHDSGNTWRTTLAALREIGYVVSGDPILLSPHMLQPTRGGAPQRRERVYILAERADLASGPVTPLHISTGAVVNWDFAAWLAKHRGPDASDPKYNLTALDIRWITAWGALLVKVGKDVSGGYPLWEKEFRASAKKKGLPAWKIRFHERNRDFYLNHQSEIDKWRTARNVANFPDSKRKLEWNVGAPYTGGVKGIFEYLIQFRPSGIRVKAPTYVGTLVASVQTPIIGWEKRYLTPGEAGLLQGFPRSFKRDPNDKAAYKQFGNAVNVSVVTLVAKTLLSHSATGILR
jgi:DNA (cytosine-5)-methyltransferase 1